jgi:hypothetical protein
MHARRPAQRPRCPAPEVRAKRITRFRRPGKLVGLPRPRSVVPEYALAARPVRRTEDQRPIAFLSSVYHLADGPRQRRAQWGRAPSGRLSGEPLAGAVPIYRSQLTGAPGVHEALGPIRAARGNSGCTQICPSVERGGSNGWAVPQGGPHHRRHRAGRRPSRRASSIQGLQRPRREAPLVFVQYRAHRPSHS